jgi:hypothetical protein
VVCALWTGDAALMVWCARSGLRVPTRPAAIRRSEMKGRDLRNDAAVLIGHTAQKL